jgi:hypothetical protein
MFIELPQTLASSSADPYPELDDALDLPQTVTVEREAGAPQVASRVRMALARAGQASTRISVQAPEAFCATFTHDG